uniref:NADH-ubiquinone oxidoreductase chain 4L n=1 Tax=Brontostoma colossus TaxID=1532881 RepID=A0A076L4I7_9HEMI|nr:NADH dehydrogenase subunit 4L [Brontostoma colossus]AIJ03000.1 NADH dehydrogenase subunit 4L [Brontostoma colossus]
MFNCVILFMFFSGFIIFCSMNYHLLLTLIGLEFLGLSLFFNFFLFLSYYNFSYYYVLVFLTFMVCESVIGLSILVSMIRSHGNDLVSSLSILGW